MTLLQHIPTYVYVLFAALLALGVSRCFPRRIRVDRLGVLPALMLVLALRGYLQLFPAPGLVDLFAAGAGLGVGIQVGWHHARRWVVQVEPARRRLTVPGDLLMLVIILCAFAFEFILHYAIATRASWLALPQTQPGAALVMACLVGMTVGRNANLGIRYRAAAAAEAFTQSAQQNRGRLNG